MIKEPIAIDNMNTSNKKKFIVKSYSSDSSSEKKIYKYEKFENTHYVWYECRGWTYLWGLNISSEDLTNRMIDKFNKDGWKINTFYRHGGYFPNLPFLLTMMIYFSTFVSFGFITYFFGHYIIVEKNFNSYEEGEKEKSKLMLTFKKERRKMYLDSFLIFLAFLLFSTIFINILLRINWTDLITNLVIGVQQVLL